ncbi:peptidoglycan recognition protein family protein [Robertmurraya siralis]|uniref:peptidoglycan recognition protein family protein n=1 Tax=Robertmurraya siralis TaxID=77777 RepID=UPI0010F74740|nr:N-acetylmuramoyl-L-alanine amidase [Robertmurraya siralis]
MSLWIDKFIKPNKFSRPQNKLTAVRKIVIHYTANNGATALNHYNYFNDLKDRYASAHIFADKKEAYCIIPLNEVAYHANDGSYRGISELKPNANFLSIGVEMCLEKNGTFHQDTIKRTEDILVELCKRYKLDPLKDIVRHYDITHKNCPAPWVKNPQHFIDFKKRVNEKLKGNSERNRIPNEGARKLKLKEWQLKEMANMYSVANNRGILSSREWVDKTAKGDITVDEALFLLHAIVNRIYFNPQK